MADPTTLPGGATCALVQRQTHLSVAGEEDNGVVSATDFYLVAWDGDASPAACRGATDGAMSVPVRGDASPDDPSLSCRRVEIRAVENNSRRHFQVRVEYDDDGATPTDPLSEPPAISWDFSEDGQQPYFVDCDPAGPKAVINTAGERFSDYLSRAGGSTVVSYARNVSPAQASALLPLINRYTNALPASNGSGGSSSPDPEPTMAVNSDPVTIDGETLAAGQVRFKGGGMGEVQTQNGVKYRVFHATLACRRRWTDVVESRGFNQINNTAAKKLVPITQGGTPNQTQTPWPLDSNGLAKPSITDAPATKTFYPYPQLPFAPFGFNSPASGT